MEYRYNHSFVADRLYELNQVKGIDRLFVSKEGAEEIKKILRLDHWLEAEDLRAIRNSVVVIYSAFIKGLGENQNRMSAIVSVIDNVMFNRFGHT